jgi:hypothetical protein
MVTAVFAAYGAVCAAVVTAASPIPPAGLGRYPFALYEEKPACADAGIAMAASNPMVTAEAAATRRRDFRGTERTISDI